MLSALMAALLATGGWATGDAAKLAKGREIYQQACALCHGQDGRGNPEWESAIRPVAFTDCGTTAEPSDLWEGVVTAGGPYAGLASVMPAFGEAYSKEEIVAVVAYLRTFCAEADRYPPGDLNFRRLLRTGKAFPEQELVLRATHIPDADDTRLELRYESRLGTRFQYELVLPLRVQAGGADDGSGLGDIEVEGKQVLAFDHASLSIFSAGLSVLLPSGSTAKRLGTGTVQFQPFLALGKGFGNRGRTVVQARAGLQIPADPDKADTRFRYAAGLSHAFGPSRRAWVPALEWSGVYNTSTKQHDYSTWVELSKPLNKLGHVIASAGAQVPIRPKSGPWRFEAYLLWDFGDGPIWLGW